MTFQSQSTSTAQNVPSGKKTFSQFLQETFTAQEYKHPIFSELGWTKTRLTQFERKPSKMRFKHVCELAEFIYCDRRHAYKLVETYGCGSANIVMDELAIINQWKDQLNQPKP